MSGGFVEVVMDDSAWVEFIEDHGPVVAARELRVVLRSLGQQESRRVSGLAEAKTDVTVSDALYESMRRDLAHWRRTASRVREKVNARLAVVRRSAQAIEDAHQADRRALVILAKRIWLWEEGAEIDGLDDALDFCTISDTDDDPSIRRTLRELIDDMLGQGQVITP